MPVSIEEVGFGKTPAGQDVPGFKLTNKNGMEVYLISYGAAILKICVPDKYGKIEDVTLGFDTIEGFTGGNPYFAVSVGRVANRIAKGRFTVDGQEYSLATNNGPNALHGGLVGFDKAVWSAAVLDQAVRFTHVSPDGDEGYPGEVTLEAEFALNDDNQLSYEYRATSTAPTPINIANHTYYNLAGCGSGAIDQHVVQLNSDHYLPVDSTLIPTGEIAPVEGTPFDFRQPRVVGERFSQVDGGGQPGYDHNFCVNGDAGMLRPCAVVSDPTSGRKMRVETTQPGVQLYTGNFLDGSVTGKGGAVFGQHSGLCLETQNYPDAVNQPNFPNALLRPGRMYSEKTVLTFSW